MNKENFIPKYTLQSNKTTSLASKSSSKARKAQVKQILSCRNDQHDDYMRLIIAKNSEYFKNKIKGPKNGGVKDLKLKIPCYTGITVYRKDYKEKQSKYTNQHQIQHNSSSGNLKNKSTLKMCIKDIKLDEKTNYQKDFKNQLIHSLSCRRFNKKGKKDNQDEDSPPGFFQTQNKSQFLNWAGQNYVPSMKPAYKSAATNLTFQATSSYRAQYDGKQAATVPICINQSSFPKFGNISMIMKSNYSHDFPIKKKHKNEPNFKPKDTNTPFNQEFKGATEYKRQFKKRQSPHCDQTSRQFETIQDLQTLIIDL